MVSGGNRIVREGSMADQKRGHDRDLQRTVVASTFCSADVHAEYVWQPVVFAIYGSAYYSKPLQPSLTCKHETRELVTLHCL